MSRAAIASRLDGTVTARWRAELVGSKSVEKAHWRTKIGYYEAVSDLLSTGAARPLTWKAIVDTVRPRGSRSTFYEVTGQHAKHSLIALLRACECVNTIQLVLRYSRRSPVDQLIDEAKVHRYWPYHTAWLRHAQTEPGLDEAALTESLLSVVAEWARRNRGLAAALDHAPPIGAVEDLLAANPGQLSALRAYAILATTIQDAIEAPVTVADVADEAARVDAGIAERRTPSPDALVVRLAEQIYAISRETQRLAPTDAAAVWRIATDLMRDIVAATT